MEYLSTTEIAKIWGVSRKTVTRYATEGKIEGAYLVGNTWMIPEDATKEDSTVSEGSKNMVDKPDDEFHFPLYIYRDFFAIKETLKRPEEQKLYAAFELFLDRRYDTAYELSSEAFSITADYPFKITCLYVMARCSLYQNKYSVFMKHALEMNQMFTADFEHKEEMRTLLIDLEAYYIGFNSLRNATFNDICKYSSELFPIITTMTLYKQIIINYKKRQTIDTSIYEMSLNLFKEKGYIYPAILLGSELALILYNQKQYQRSMTYAKYAYELAVQYNGFFILTELYSFAPRVLDKALKYYKITMDPTLKQMTKEFRHSNAGLLLYLKKPKSLFAFTNDDYDYICYAINNYTNKEIAQKKSISENAVSQRYAKLYRSFDVTNKKELVEAFINTLDQY